MSKQVTFILIDDDAISNMLSEIIIEDEFPDAQIISFTDPKQGIQFFESEFSESSINKTFLFLDINMPLMSGWEFLESLKEKRRVGSKGFMGKHKRKKSRLLGFALC